MKTKPLSHEPVISVRGITKKFVIPHERITTLKGFFVNLLRKKTYETFYALNDVSFDVVRGECLGIVGKNGSGKSTLLKILAGVYSADSGAVTLNGRISPFLELGIGFNPELSGRDNIYLNATVLGMSKKMIDEKFDSIVEFSEIGRFIDQKLKNYSSGMQVRLAFSVAIHANREILLLDEVLAVGDANFQRKCINEFEKYRKAGKTIILVTHDSQMVQQYCDRAILINKGAVECIGDPHDVILKYQEINMSDEDRRLRQELLVKERSEQEEREKSEEDQEEKNTEESSQKEVSIKKIRVQSCKVFNDLGKETFSLETGKSFSVALRVAMDESIDRMVFGVMFKNGMGKDALGLHSFYSRYPLKAIALEKGTVAEILFEGEMLLTQGTYTIYIGIANNKEYLNYDLLFSEETNIVVSVFGNDMSWGPVNSNHTTTFKILEE